MTHDLISCHNCAILLIIFFIISERSAWCLPKKAGFQDNYNGDVMLEKTRRGYVAARSNFFRFARYNLLLSEQKIIYYALMIGDKEGRPFEPVEMAVTDFLALSGSSTKAIYNRIMTVANNLVSRTVEVAFKTEDGIRYTTFPWLTEITYHKGKVYITPNKALRDYIVGEPFSTMEYYYLFKFTSQYSARMYELLKSMNFKPLVDFSIEDLRNRLGIPDETYTNYGDLKRRVLTPAINDINKFTDLAVTMKEKKYKKKVQAILFTLDKKDVGLLADRVDSGEFQDDVESFTANELEKLQSSSKSESLKDIESFDTVSTFQTSFFSPTPELKPGEMTSIVISEGNGENAEGKTERFFIPLESFEDEANVMASFQDNSRTAAKNRASSPTLSEKKKKIEKPKQDESEEELLNKKKKELLEKLNK